MITEFLKEKYITSKCQIIVIGHDGNITETDNYLFETNNGTQITNLHPFFETISHLLPDKNKEHVFHCVNLEINEVKGNYNIVFFSGSDTLNPYLIFYDFTENCDYLQTIVQRRNDSVIALETQLLKEKQHISEKKFKNKFLANISHDLKTPLGAVLGFLEILNKTPLNNEQKDLINTIRKSGNHIKSLIDDLLDLSKIEAGELKINYSTFSVYDLINHIQKIYTPILASKNLLFNPVIQQNIPPFLVCDKTRVLQIFINLLDNAFKFTNEGSISLNIASKTINENSVEFNFSITDTGIGFPDAKRNSINSFTKFHQTDIEGSGLGLSIVKKLVENMNGKMQILPGVKQGTCVQVAIPMQTANGIVENLSNNQKIPLTETHLQILIADDNEVNIRLIKKMLKDYPNLTIETAKNGVEVLEIVEQKYFDLILMDIEMPEMNGLEASQKIKTHPNPTISNIPVIAITANATEIEKYTLAGISGYVSKPFLKQDLLIAIEKIFVENLQKMNI